MPSPLSLTFRVPGFDAWDLPHKYIAPASGAEARVLVRHLGVKALTAAEAYKRHVVGPGGAAAGSLPAAARDAALLRMLHALPALAAQDPTLVPFLWCVWGRCLAFLESMGV